MFTSAIEAVVTWKHDPAAHNVPFKAAWPKRVPDPAALEQFSIIYKRTGSDWCFMSHTCVWYNPDTDGTVKTQEPLLPFISVFVFGWAIWSNIHPSIFWTADPVQPTHTVQTDKLIPTHSYRQFRVSSSLDLHDLDCGRKPEQPEEAHADMGENLYQILSWSNNTWNFIGSCFQRCNILDFLSYIEINYNLLNISLLLTWLSIMIKYSQICTFYYCRKHEWQFGAVIKVTVGDTINVSKI